MEPVGIDYKGMYAQVDFVKRQVLLDTGEFNSKILEERVKKELVLICGYYVKHYDETRSIAPLGDARRFAALVAIPKEYYGDITQYSIEELVKRADVTEEFAQYRISLEVEQN